MKLQHSNICIDYLKGLVENYAKWKIYLFCVFSKVPEFLLVAFKLLEIHWAAFFSLFYTSFSRKNGTMQKPRFSRWHVFKPGFLHTFFLKNEA